MEGRHVKVRPTTAIPALCALTRRLWAPCYGDGNLHLRATLHLRYVARLLCRMALPPGATQASFAAEIFAAAGLSDDAISQFRAMMAAEHA